jgi:opacity protein-like surface antigen
MNLRECAASLAAIAALGMPAAAQTYGKVGIGTGVVDENDVFGPRFQLGVGKRLEQGTRLELEAIGSTSDLGGDDEVTSAGVFANALFDFDLSYSLSSYVGAGVGLGHTEAETTFEDKDTALAGQAMLGLSFNLSDYVIADVGARYVAWPEPERVTGQTGSADAVFNLRFER